MGLWTDVVGTVRGYIRLGLTGVRLKNSSGTLAVRNAGDSADAGASCGALTLSDKLTFADSSVLNSSPSGQFKNKIIGGDFTTNPWQRGTSFAAASSGYTADRWIFDKFSSGVVATIAKTADAPTAAQAGIFSQHCLHVDITTADTSIAAGDGCIIEQRVEGYNAACFGFGQSGTRYVTLSFWVKSTKTGTFCVALQNSDQTRAYVAEYTVNATDTWEKKSITIPVDTTGTWLYDSGTGVSIVFALAAGSSLQTTGGSWQTVSGATIATSNQVNALDSVNNNFKLALVQLEAGSVATPFETRAVGQELALCQRYFQLAPCSAAGGIVGYGTKQGAQYIIVYSPWRVTMRAACTWENQPTSWVAGAPTTGQMAAYDYTTAAYITISGALTVIPPASSIAGQFTFLAGTSFSGTAGAVVGPLFGDIPKISAEL